jgi:hypothetical protein
MAAMATPSLKRFSIIDAVAKYLLAEQALR